MNPFATFVFLCDICSIISYFPKNVTCEIAAKNIYFVYTMYMMAVTCG